MLPLLGQDPSDASGRIAELMPAVEQVDAEFKNPVSHLKRCIHTYILDVVWELYFEQFS